MMTVSAMQQSLGLTVLALPYPDREISGGYAGDLLSWVMGRAKEGDLWATIMTNINVLAVAALIDLSCVVLTENVQPDEQFISTALSKGINLLKTSDNTFDFCRKTATLF